MKCTFSEQPYQWQDGDAWHVGQLVMDGGPVTRFGVAVGTDVLIGTDRVQVRHLYTNALEFVEWGKLLPYPQGVIPEPTNTGKAVEGE